MSAAPKTSRLRKAKRGTHCVQRLVRRLGWTRINSNRTNLPKTGFVVAGSYRNGEWSTSSLSDGDGYPSWADDDRTHFYRLSDPLPQPPNFEIGVTGLRLFPEHAF